nr:hypothetical protein [uncultured Brumimicrobium sp.]
MKETTIESFVKTIIEKFNSQFHLDDVKLLKKYVVFKYEHYLKDPEKWDRLITNYHDFKDWITVNSFEWTVNDEKVRLIKFSEDIYLRIYYDLEVLQMEQYMGWRIDGKDGPWTVKRLRYPSLLVPSREDLKKYQDKYNESKGVAIDLWDSERDKSIEKEREAYLKRVKKLDKIYICIVGQDVYRNGHTGIPFSKETINELIDEYCCGKDVLNSLNYGIGSLKHYRNPSDVFYELLDGGIAFVNISHKLLDETTESELIEYSHYNKQILSKAEEIVVLGKSKSKALFERYYPEYKGFQTFIHPSQLARKSNPKEWENTWGKYTHKLAALYRATKSKVG